MAFGMAMPGRVVVVGMSSIGDVSTTAVHRHGHGMEDITASCVANGQVLELYMRQVSGRAGRRTAATMAVAWSARVGA